MSDKNYTEIRNLGNTYGGLLIKQVNDKYYSTVEDYTTDFDDIEYWQEIPKSLYDELIKYNNSLPVPEETPYISLKNITLFWKRRNLT